MLEQKKEWLETRRRGIGGSDAAKVMGLSRWGGPLSVYFDKVNEPREDESISEAVYFGTMLEDFVAKEFSKRTGLAIRRHNKTVFSREHPFMLANVDRVIQGQKCGLECKTANAYKDGEWSGDDLPQEYYCQVQHYASVMGWEGCWIACLIGGQKFVYKFVPRNEGFIRDMVQSEREFWEDHVMTRTPPAAGMFDKVFEAQHTDDLLKPEQRDIEYAMELLRIREQIKELETHKTLIENVLKQKIGDNAGIEGIATFLQGRETSSVDWEGVARSGIAESELDSLIEAHTKKRPGSRRFLFKFKEA